MRFVHYQQGQAYLEGVSLKTLADDFGTPCYVYSRQTLEANYSSFQQALLKDLSPERKHFICYAVKANSNLTILNILARLGAGFDLVSGGELQRVLAAGGDPKKIVFSGVGKQSFEIEAALKAGIFCFNVESESELDRIQEVAKRLGKNAPIALRINPNIDAETHPHISTGLTHNKFGIELKALRSLLQKIKQLPNIQLIGLAAHIGSQLVSLDPLLKVMHCLKKLYLDLAADGLYLEYLNVGGGLGVRYCDEEPPSRQAYVQALRQIFDPYPVNLILEPGRSIVAEAGLLLTRVEYLKPSAEKNFAIVDAAMNDLMRPALYNAWHDIIPVTERPSLKAQPYEIVGPVCESTDVLGQDRQLRIEAGDVLAILMAGAYGFSMSSNYNSRPRPAEVLVDQDQCTLIRKREIIEDSFALEQSPNKEPYGFYLIK